MVKNIYSIHDRLIGFLNIVLEENDEVACRNFRNSMKLKHSALYANKEDLSLFKHGSYDTLTGEIVPCPTPVCIIRGIDIMLDKEE